MREAGAMLGPWESFYVMTGSSAAALTGLVFVVMTLVGEQGGRTRRDGVSTFTSPTVFHFCSALFISLLMSAPFPSLVPIGIILGLAGAGGLFYVARIAMRASKLRSYRPDVEDWTFNAALPFVAYATLIGGALAMQAAPSQALFAPAAAVALLIFVGIHNAWDVVTFIATGKAAALPDPPPDDDAPTRD